MLFYLHPAIPAQPLGKPGLDLAAEQQVVGSILHQYLLYKVFLSHGHDSDLAEAHGDDCLKFESKKMNEHKHINKNSTC